MTIILRVRNREGGKGNNKVHETEIVKEWKQTQTCYFLTYPCTNTPKTYTVLYDVHYMLAVQYVIL